MKKNTSQNTLIPTCRLPVRTYKKRQNPFRSGAPCTYFMM